MVSIIVPPSANRDFSPPFKIKDSAFHRKRTTIILRIFKDNVEIFSGLKRLSPYETKGHPKPRQFQFRLPIRIVRNDLNRLVQFSGYIETPREIQIHFISLSEIEGYYWSFDRTYTNLRMRLYDQHIISFKMNDTLHSVYIGNFDFVEFQTLITRQIHYIIRIVESEMNKLHINYKKHKIDSYFNLQNESSMDGGLTWYYDPKAFQCERILRVALTTSIRELCNRGSIIFDFNMNESVVYRILASYQTYDSELHIRIYVRR